MDIVNLETWVTQFLFIHTFAIQYSKILPHLPSEQNYNYFSPPPPQEGRHEVEPELFPRPRDLRVKHGLATSILWKPEEEKLVYFYFWDGVGIDGLAQSCIILMTDMWLVVSSGIKLFQCKFLQYCSHAHGQHVRRIS